MFDFLAEESPVGADGIMAPPTMERGLSSALTLRILSAKKNITVNVSGTHFCITPLQFQQLENLGWYEDKGAPYLNANPVVFEMLLQFLLFDSLPDVASLTPEQSTELQDLAVPVHGLESLIEHVATAQTADKKRKSTTSFLRRNLVPSLTSGMSRKKQRKSEVETSVPVQETIYPFAASSKNSAIDVDYLPNLQACYSTDSEDAYSAYSIATATTAANSVSSFNALQAELRDEDDTTNNGDDPAAPGPEKRERSTKRRNSIFKSVLSSGKKEHKTVRAPSVKKEEYGRKWTHEQWCASEYVL